MIPSRLIIDPRIQFGDVCVENTRVPADALSGCVLAGDSVDYVADSYGVTRADVLLACWWRVQEATYGRRTKGNQRVAVQWGEWAVTVFRSLAGYEGEPEPWDPPEFTP